MVLRESALMSSGRAAAFFLLLAACESGPEPLTGACGGEPGLYVFGAFADEELRQETTHIQAIVREPALSGDGCDALWSTGDPTSLAQQLKEETLAVADQGILFPLALDQYPKLDVFVFAQGGAARPAAEAMAGGCAHFVVIPDEDTQCILVELAANPR